MIDFTNKCIVTENNVESEQLLKKAIAQGFNLPKGQKAMESNRYFHFIGSPYKHVTRNISGRWKKDECRKNHKPQPL